ncbi:MAG: hypothetical protein GY800_08420 [Planctomycetes bacterium]|nr:hypothetical protein [Planctomycetota bacterium]
MNYFLLGLSVFLGVIAGTAVTIATQMFFQWKSEKHKLSNLKFEFMLNIKKIDGFLNELTKYRNAVNGDSLNMYFGYFDLSRVVSVIANDMFSSGLMYRYLTHEDIGKVQVVFSELSLNGENYINNQITQSKAQFDKQKAVGDVDFWEKKFKDHKKTFQEILSKLEQL